jgi:TatD family-associated radical SAM protein
MKKETFVYWLDDNLYLNITNNCSNNCYFCFRNFKNGVGGFNLRLKQEPSIEEIISELKDVINKRNWEEVVFCGFGEPMMRLDVILDVTKSIKKNYNKTIRIDTNGQAYLLNPGRDVVKELKDAGVDKLSISLNAPDKKTYDEICRPKIENAYESVLEFIKKAKDKFDLEVTAVRVPELDIDAIELKAKELGVKLRIREYIPCFY